MEVVKNSRGKVLGKVPVGTTKLQALESLGVAGVPGHALLDKDGVVVIGDSAIITAGKGPYVWKTTQPIPLFARLFARRGGRLTDEQILGRLEALQARDEEREILGRLEALQARDEALQARDEALQARVEALQARDEKREIHGAKASGEYFTVNRLLWKKSSIDVNGKQPEDAAKMITERIKEWKPPFLDLCKMPSVEEIQEAQTQAFQSICAGNEKRKKKVEVASEDEVMPVSNPNWRLEKTKDQMYQSSSLYNQAQNIFGTSAMSSRKDGSPNFSSLAHASPADVACSLCWEPFLPLLTGEENGSVWQRFFAIHGLFNSSQTNFGVDYAYHGIKNVTQNLLALPPNHGTVYDGSASGNLIIVPIVDLESDPEKTYGINSHFDLLVIARSNSVYQWIYQGDSSAGVNIFGPSVDKGVEEATERDIRIATKFLRTYVSAATHLGLTGMKPRLGKEEGGDEIDLSFEKMFSMVHQMTPDAKAVGEQESVSSKRTANKEDLKKILNKAKIAFRDIEERGAVWVPDVLDNFSFENNKILKVKLGAYFEERGVPTEYYPSWSMLGLKAAANWLNFAMQPFIPSCRDVDLDTFPVGSIEINSYTDDDSLDGSLDDSLTGSLEGSLGSNL